MSKVLKIFKKVNGLFAGHTALQAASQNGNIDIIKILLKYNVDLEIEDKDGDRAIHHAAFGDEPDVIELLALNSSRNSPSTSIGIDLNSRNKKRQTALHIAVNKGHLNVVKVLIKFGALISLQDADGDTPLHDAISKKNDLIIDLLLEANADLSICNNNGFNSIHHAALRGNTSSMRLLLNKINQQQKYWLIDEKKDDGFSALHLACLNNYFDIVKLIVDNIKQLNIDIKNLNQQTALHLASERTHYQIIKLLLDNKSNINTQDKDGDTPMHCILRNYSIYQMKQSSESANTTSSFNASTTSISDKINTISTIAYLFIDYGANLSIRNKKYQTPLELCSDINFAKCLSKYYNDILAQKISSSQTNIPSQQYNSNQSISFDQKSKLESLDECMICSDNKREVLFKPCNHISACKQCSSRCKKCLICKEQIQERVEIDECMVCNEKKSSILFQPCGHLCTCDACSKLMKKCIKCKSQIEKQITFQKCCETLGSSQQNLFDSTNNKNENLIDKTDVKKLQHELEFIKEQTICPVCLDKLKNMVFLCGHGTCQNCGDQMKECPICRKEIKQRILIY